MATQVRNVRTGSVPMYDLEGNRYMVHITTKQILTTYTEGSSTRWIDDAKSYDCAEGRVNPQDDGSFLLVTTGVLIYPKSRLPRESERQAQTPPAP